MIGSHNTMSYLPAKNLWGMITKYWSRCQDKNLIEQYNAGARFFDIRVCKKKDGWHYVHNKADYGIADLQALIDFFKTHTDTYVRLIYDLRSTPKDPTERRISFYKEVVYPLLSNAWVRITYITFWDWNVNYTHTLSVGEIENHASVSAKWWAYILWGTKGYAKIWNEDNLQKYDNVVASDTMALLIDFI